MQAEGFDPTSLHTQSARARTDYSRKHHFFQFCVIEPAHCLNPFSLQPLNNQIGSNRLHPIFGKYIWVGTAQGKFEKNRRESAPSGKISG